MANKTTKTTGKDADEDGAIQTTQWTAEIDRLVALCEQARHEHGALVAEVAQVRHDLSRVKLRSVRRRPAHRRTAARSA